MSSAKAVALVPVTLQSGGESGGDVDEHYLRQAQWARGQLGLRERISFLRSNVCSLARRREPRHE
jgi:hypothetical protein